MATGNVKKSRRRAITFHVLAVLLALLPFVLFEFALHVLDIGEPTEATYPSIGFEAILPLFELSESGERFEVAKSRQAYFCPDSFAANKSSNEFRIFCLGGSTVQGRPYSIETSFTSWLGISLQSADPSRTWEVVNCGGVSYASYRLVPILEEVLNYEPDLIVVYSGHNEFLEARTFDAQAKTKWMSRIRTINVVRSALQDDSRLERGSESNEVLTAEVDALLDYRGGLADYHRDNSATQGVVQQYGQNIRKLIGLCDVANVPIVLINPASNLKDTPPFKVESSGSLGERELGDFETLVDQSRQTTDAEERVALLEQAIDIDPRQAGARFLLAHAYLAQHRFDDAKQQFVAAKDEDVCPLRMIEPLHQALASVAKATQTPLLDFRRAITVNASNGIPGDLEFLDHIHPSIDKHQELANLLVSHLIDSGVCKPIPNWQATRDVRYREHLSTLDTPYYAKGKQRLEGLMRWTQGRANKLHDATSLPLGLNE